MGEKYIKEFKIIEHFINKDFNIECGIYEIRTNRAHYFIIQTENDYKAISHAIHETELLPIRENIIEEIKELLQEGNNE